MPHTTVSRLAALVVGGLLAASCSFDPISEVETSNAPPQPQTLAFADDGGDGEASATEPVAGNAEVTSGVLAQSTDPALIVPAGPWISGPESTTVGVHSAPDSLYTRLGSLNAGDGVIATGRRVDTAGVIWMEINWNDASAWVNEAPFSRFVP